MLKITAVFALFLLAAAPLSGQEMKFGVINSEFIIQNYPPFRNAEAQLGREVEAWEKERVDWEAEMNQQNSTILDLDKRLKAGENIFTEQRKNEMRATIDSLRMDFEKQLMQRSSFEQERMNKRRAELLSEVFEVVNQVIDEIGEQNGYDLIIDSANGSVVYAKDPEDINDLLLRTLQEK